MHSQLVISTVYRKPWHHRCFFSALCPPICCKPQAQVMWGTPACITRRLRVTKGWCKAELQDFSSAELLCSLSWAVDVQQPLWEGFRAFLGRGWLVLGTPIPFQPMIPCHSFHPQRPQLLYHTHRACPAQSSLYSMNYSKFLALSSMVKSACYLLLGHEPDKSFAWEAGAWVTEVTRT